MNKRDFVLFFWLLHASIILAALLSASPVILTPLAMLLCGALWIFHRLDFSNTNNTELTSVIFADGRLRLESSRDGTIQGFLSGQQWCTPWLAVLQFFDGKANRRLVIRAAQQTEPGNYRRLNMWLQQYTGDNTRQTRVLNVKPAQRVWNVDSAEFSGNSSGVGSNRG